MKITWLGQAGYRLRMDSGTVIMIDPYLSDSLHLTKGASYRREIEIDESLLSSHIDTLVLTHLHADHTDFATLDKLLAANGPVNILAPKNVLLALRNRYACEENYMMFNSGVEITLDSVLFRAAFAAHSDESPIGVVIEGGDRIVCHTGDTMYHRSLLTELPHQADALMLPINGSGYNMNAVDAARLTRALAPHTVLPMHWDMFRAHGCDVADFTALFSDVQEPRVLIPKHYTEFEL